MRELIDWDYSELEARIMAHTGADWSTKTRDEIMSDIREVLDVLGEGDLMKLAHPVITLREAAPLPRHRRGRFKRNKR